MAITLKFYGDDTGVPFTHVKIRTEFIHLKRVKTIEILNFKEDPSASRR